MLWDLLGPHNLRSTWAMLELSHRVQVPTPGSSLLPPPPSSPSDHPRASVSWRMHWQPQTKLPQVRTMQNWQGSGSPWVPGGERWYTLQCGSWDSNKETTCKGTKFRETHKRRHRPKDSSPGLGLKGWGHSCKLVLLAGAEVYRRRMQRLPSRPAPGESGLLSHPGCLLVSPTDRIPMNPDAKRTN